MLQLDDVANLVSALPMLIARVTGANSVVLFLLDGDKLFRHGLISHSALDISQLRQVALSMQGLDVVAA